MVIVLFLPHQETKTHTVEDGDSLAALIMDTPGEPVSFYAEERRVNLFRGYPKRGLTQIQYQRAGLCQELYEDPRDAVVRFVELVFPDS